MISSRRGGGVYVSESILVIGARRDVGVYVSESMLVIGARRDVGVFVSESTGCPKKNARYRVMGH